MALVSLHAGVEHGGPAPADHAPDVESFRQPPWRESLECRPGSSVAVTVQRSRRFLVRQRSEIAYVLDASERTRATQTSWNRDRIID